MPAIRHALGYAVFTDPAARGQGMPQVMIRTTLRDGPAEGWAACGLHAVASDNPVIAFDLQASELRTARADERTRHPADRNADAAAG